MRSLVEEGNRKLPSIRTIQPDRRRHTVARAARVAVPMAVAVVLALAGPAGAATCNVPSGTYPTIQSAVDAPSCSPIIVAAGTYAEAVVVSRSLEITGAGSGASFIYGGIEILAGTVSVTGFHLSGSGEALWAHSGAEVSGFDLGVVNGTVETPLFANGFEGGTTDAWTEVSP